MRAAAAAAALGLVAAAPAAALQHLDSAPLLPVTRLSTGPLVVGDFNGDGRRDLAYALHNPTGVAVSLGDGQGGYSVPLVSRIATSTISSAEAMVAADFNADGRLDLALADFATGPSVYLGLGDGRFAGVSLGGEPLNLGLATGDFDGDGRRDLAMSHRGFTSVAQVFFYRGDGTGAFAAPVVWNLPMLLLPTGLVARDFDGDGRDDVAVADNFGNAVAVLMGSATLAPIVRGPFPSGDGAMGIDAGDLDGDGRLDVVTADERGRTVSVLRGDGAGSLGPPSIVPGPARGRRVVIGAFDGDGRLDVAVSGAGLWTFAGNGAGGLLPPRRYGVSGDLAAADLTLDGRLDLVAGPSLLAGDGAGGFAAQRTFPMPPGAQAAVAADFDHDGHLDVAAAHAAGTVSVMHGDGLGGFGTASSTLTGTDPVDLAAADFNGDGWSDLAVAHAGTQDVAVLLNDHAGGFTRASYPVNGVPQSLALADFSGDGIVDIAVANETAGAIFVLHGLPGGTFAIGGTTFVGDGSLALVAGAFNADGRADLAWARVPSGGSLRVQMLAGTGAESFVPGPPVELYTSAHALVAADLDADGALDLVGGGDHQPIPQVSGLGVRLGDGQGGFGSSVFQPPILVQSLAVADVTQDGRPDVAAFEPASLPTGVRLLAGNGDGSFGLLQAPPVPVGGSGPTVLAADFDEDGRPDLAALVTEGDTLTVLRGRAATGGADLAISVEGSPDPAGGGQPVTYVATVVNHGPLAVTGPRVRFRVPLGMTYVSHQPSLPLCAADQGLVTCDLASLAAGASFELTVVSSTEVSGAGQPVGWADVYGLAPDETAPADNFTTFSTRINPIDLALSVSDSADPVQPGQAFHYTLQAVNEGAYAASRVFVRCALPAGVTLVQLPPSCDAPNDVDITCGMQVMSPGQSVSFQVDVQAGIFTSVSLAADVDADQVDIDLSDNVDVEETRMRLGLPAELGHGSAWRGALPAGSPAQEAFLLRVPPWASFEVVLDEVSGDLSGALPVSLERLHADTSSVLQAGAPLGVGRARVLRWQNVTAETFTQLIRVRSQGCTTDCGSDDTYRLRVYDTSGAFARFNTTGDQETIVILQNPTAGAVNGTLWFWRPDGALLASRPFSIAARRSFVLNVATILPGTAGAITLTHDGGYGALAGKAVAIQPATGFSYDTPLTYRPR
ncbi:MAG TPA: FG-GAP-like repeat-containing protein [Vicinamibacteria bacterium]|nr:FG-GAP-like repeat-containing protein [Vicinamibacteria bacterium]